MITQKILKKQTQSTITQKSMEGIYRKYVGGGTTIRLRQKVDTKEKRINTDPHRKHMMITYVGEVVRRRVSRDSIC